MANCTCGREWTGLAQAHCSICHVHFSTVANFDRHKPSYAGCLDPAEITNRKGEALLRPDVGRFGITWVGASERPDLSGDPGNDAHPGMAGAA
ncbi:MAG TPA: hypothetical protein VFH56_02205 [Acidimicrobiales bacterium]|nr:hypothetical protein [Acidimicrobiales bacterium]